MEALEQPVSILMVDDRPENLLSLEVILQPLGQRLVRAASGFEALRRLLEEDYAVILLDVQMPDMDGFETARLIRGRERSRQTPIIFLTAYGSSDVQVLGGYAVGAVDYVVKPINPEILRAKVGVFVELAQGRARLARSEALLREANAELERRVLERTRALRASEEQYRTLAEAAPDAVLIVDRALCLEYLNATAAALLGGRPADFVGLRLADLLPPAEAELLCRRVESVLETGRPVSLEGALPGVAPPRWLHAVLTPLGVPGLGPDGRPTSRVRAVLVIARDLTERRQAEEALQAGEERYRLLFDRMAEGLAVHEIICDADGKPIDYRFLDLNPAFEQITGLTRAIVGKTALEVLPDLEPSWIETYGRVALTREPVQFESYSQSLGKQFEVTAYSPRPGQFATLFFDVTERRQAEEQVRREAARTAALARVAARLNANLDLDAVLTAICEETAAALEAPAATVALLDEGAGVLRVVAQQGLPADYVHRRPPLPTCWVERIWQDRGEVAVLPDLLTVPDLPGRSLMSERGLRSGMFGRLSRNGELVGALNVLTFEPRSFTPDDVALLKGIADQAGQAIANARLLVAARRRAEHLDALRQIDVAITGSLDRDLTLRVVAEQAVAQLRADACAVLLLNPHSQALQPTAGRGFRRELRARTPQRLGAGPAGLAALERRTVAVRDLADAEAGAAAGLDAAYAQEFAVEGFCAYHAAPLIAKGQVCGVLEVFHRAPFAPEPDWLAFLEALAGQAAIAVDGAALFDGLQRSNAELHLAYDATIEGWSRALDLRDKETEGHTLRVTELTLRFCQALGASEAELVHVRRGALLHDIGKMGVPDAVLLKPGPLTPEEWVVMRQHPVLARELLWPVAYLRPALEIPFGHHEKWDGSGYPRGLQGEEIPLAARAFALVDVWDALRSDRPYRAAWPVERVRAQILAGVGSHFDPRLVPKFLELA